MEHWAARWHTVQPVEAMFGLEYLVAAACFAAETAETAETDILMHYSEQPRATYAILMIQRTS